MSLRKLVPFLCGVGLVTGRAYATRECVVPAEEIFYDQAARPGGTGAWLGEADKVSWRDTAKVLSHAASTAPESNCSRWRSSIVATRWRTKKKSTGGSIMDGQLESPP